MTLSNKLTLSRILVVPIFILFMSLNSLWANILALVVFVYAALTDLYDGYLARRNGQVTRLGRFLDPLADKMIVTAAMISFVSIESLSIPAWIIIVIIAREFIINDLRDLAVSNDVEIRVSKAGKIKTIMQMVAIITILSLMVLEALLSSIISWGGIVLRIMSLLLMVVAMLATVGSGIDYMLKGGRQLKEKKVL